MNTTASKIFGIKGFLLLLVVVSTIVILYAPFESTIGATLAIPFLIFLWGDLLKIKNEKILPRFLNITRAVCIFSILIIILNKYSFFEAIFPEDYIDSMLPILDFLKMSAIGFFCFSVGVLFTEKVRSNSIQSKIPNLSSSELPSCMHVGNSYEVVSTFSDSNTGWKICVLKEFGYSFNSKFFMVRLSPSQQLPNVFNVEQSISDTFNGSAKIYSFERHFVGSSKNPFI